MRRHGRSCGRGGSYVFLFDEAKNEFVRKPGVRQRIICRSDSGQTSNVLPAAVNVEDLRYEISTDGVRVITAGAGFQMDVSEFGSRL